MLHTIQLSAQDTAGPRLAELLKRAGEKAKLNQAVSVVAAELTRRHILEKVAPSRHTTAQRLGASPTNYLMKAGQSVIERSDADGAQVIIQNNTAIFARTRGPVTIKPGMSFGPVAPDGRGGTGKKWLTIPATAAAFGRRAGEFADLVFAQKKNSTTAMLLRVPKYQKKSDGKRRTKAEAESYRAELKSQTRVFYWLRKEVTLPADPGLLPNAQAYTLAARLGVRDYFKDQITEEGTLA